MTDHKNDIDELLRMLDPQARMRPQWKLDEWEVVTPGTACVRYHAALTALVAERDALVKRVEELEAQPKPSSDLRERLVCAIWPQMLRSYADGRDADGNGYAWDQAKESSRAEALEEADAMIAAMRKGVRDE